MIRLAQLSDTHLLAEPGELLFGQDSSASLTSVITAFPVRPDVAVVTGDVAHDGTAEAYRRARALTAPLAPEVHYLAGNHDDPRSMDQVLGSDGALRMVPLTRGWAMALVSSRWAGHDAGRVGEQTLLALDEALARTRASVVVCLHHPPRSTCSDLDCTLVNSTAFLRVLGRAGTVRAVLSGHLHRPFDRVVEGIRFLGAPSTFQQLEHGGEPHFTVSDAPPAARLVELHGDGSVASRLVPGRVRGHRTATGTPQQ